MANQGYTVVVMWENTETDKKGNRYSGHISTVRPYFRKDEEDKGPRISNVGRDNELSTVSKSFQKGFEDGTVKYYYDRNQTFRANEGFERYGLAYNDLTGKQSISIHDSTYDENNYINYGKRKAEENEYLGKLKEEKFEEYLKQHPELYNSESKKINFDNPFLTYELTKYALGKMAFSVLIDSRAKELRNNNMTLLSIIRKGDKNVDDVLLGRITAGNYIEQKKAERAAQEKAIAEAEAKRIAEEKAAQEKAEKERQDKEKLAREDEERRRKEGGNNPSPNPKKPDEDRSEPILDEDDRPGRRNKKGEKPIKSPPKKDGGGNNPPPPKNNPPPKKGGGGGGSKPKPPKIPKPGDMIPLSIDTNNEYYLGSLYGTKPFSAQESSAFNSTIISNELSALQPITSLNVAGLPVNDTAIKEDPFGV